MKKVINFFSFLIFLTVSISSIVNSTLTQKMNGIDLAGILTLNQASAEDDPKFTVAYEVVNCVRTYPVGPDGKTIEVHTVTCYGVGNKECKCTGH